MGRAKNLGHEARARSVGAERAAVGAARAGARVRPRSLVAITPRVSPSDGLAPAGVVPARRARRRIRERRAAEARGGPPAVRRVRRVRQQLRRERDTVHRTIHAPHDLHTRRRRPHAPTPRPLARRRSPRLGSTRARAGASPSSRLGSWNRPARHSRESRRPSPAQVVIAVSPQEPNQTVCKRLTALPGDVVHVAPSSDWVARRVCIPPGHVWLQARAATRSDLRISTYRRMPSHRGASGTHTPRARRSLTRDGTTPASQSVITNPYHWA